MRVLIIEDSPFYQRLFANFFSNHDVQFTLAEDGLQGLDVFDQQDFDCVFVDINLPDLSGWEVIRSIYSDQSDVRVIPVTGYDVESAKVLFHNLSHDRFLIKPFGDEDLEELMEFQESINKNGGVMDQFVTSKQEMDSKANLKNFCEEMGADTALPLLEIFLNEVNTKVPSLKSLLEQGHYSDIENTVHQLKSNCRYFGFNEYAEICDRVEQLVVRGEYEQVCQLIDSLLDKSDSLVAISKQVMSELVCH